jgi:hypothetical protein
MDDRDGQCTYLLLFIGYHGYSDKQRTVETDMQVQQEENAH